YRDLRLTSKLSVTSGTLPILSIIKVLRAAGLYTLSLHDALPILSVQKSLSMNKIAAAHTNSGTITVAGGDLSVGVGVPGTTPSLIHTGSISIASHGTMSIGVGTLSKSGVGTISGVGTRAVAVLSA